jgi:uncharacterized repeat protein (TIGR01451 family)
MRQRHEVFRTRASRGRGRRLFGSVLAVSALMVGGLAGFGPDRAKAQALGSPASAVTVAGGNGVGNGANQFDNPADVAIDDAGNLYVADLFNHRVQKWGPGDLTGTTVAGGIVPGSADNQLSQPISVTVRGQDLYISDRGNHRVQKWSIGAALGQTAAGANGVGSDPNQLNLPNGVEVDSVGNLVISDSSNHRIQRWVAGAAAGSTVAGGNGPGGASSQFNITRGIAMDSADNVYVPDDLNHRIQKWVPGAASGVTIAGGNGQGSNADQLNRPQAVVVDKTGNLYVSDMVNHRVQRWAPGATSGVTILGGNSAGSATNQLNFPAGLNLDRFGNLLVADSTNNRIQKINVDTTTPTSEALTATPSVLGVGGSSVLGVVGSDDFAIAKAEFFEGATLLGTDTTPDPGGLFSFVVTPTTIGVHTYTVVLTDGAGNTVTSAPGTLTVNTALTPPTFNVATPTPATVGSAYSFTFTASGEPAPTFAVASGSALPAGMTLTSAGVLSGTPTSAGSFAFEVLATNNVGTASTFATLVVVPVIATPVDLRVKLEGPASVRVGQNVKYEVEVSNGSTSTAVAGPIVVAYALPLGTSFVGTDGSGWTCAVAGAVLTCTRASGLAALASVQLKIRVLIGTTAGATLTNTVSVTPLDAAPANNTALLVSRVRR